MRRLGLFLLSVFLVLVPVALAQSAQPDLVVQEVRLSPVEPEPGDAVQIGATVANKGRGDASQSFDIRFKVDDLTVGRQRVARLRAGKTVEVQVEWQAVEGEHLITVEVDQPSNNIQETDERNNSLQVMVTVRRRAAVYSITAEIGLTIGESLRTAGEGFNFTLGSDIFAALEEGIKQLGEVGLALNSAGTKLIQIGKGLPPPLSTTEAIRGGRAVGEVFLETATSLAAAAGALRNLSINSAVAAIGEIETELDALSKLSFARVPLGQLAEAAAYVGKAAEMAQTLATSLFGGNSSSAQSEGKSIDELIAEFQTALSAAGEVLSTVGAQIEDLTGNRGIILTDGDGRSLETYHPEETLFIQAYGAVWLYFEVYNSEGELVARRVVVDERLQWQGEDNSRAPLPAGEYFYRLQADRGAGEETDIGRILIS
jgi:hypothetical protein